MKTKHLSTAIVCILAATALSFAQNARLYTVSSGLISSQVDGVFQDKEGYIWITSGFGLVRYDGHTFESFYHDESDPNSISCDNAHIIFEDSRGTIWVGTEHGLNIFDFDHNQFSLVPLPFNDPDIVELYEVYSGPEESYIIARAKADGIFVINAQSHEVDLNKTNNITELIHGRSQTMTFLDSKGLLWICNSKDGVICYDFMREQEISLIWDDSAEKLRNNIQASSIIEDEENSDLYIGSSRNGIFIVDRETYNIRRAGSSEKQHRISVIAYKGKNINDSDKYLFVGTEEEGLLLFNIDDETFTRYSSPNYQLSQNAKIKDILKDKQDNIWLAAYQLGVIIIPDSSSSFISYTFNQRGIPGLNSACITSVTENRELDCRYVGTDGAGLFVLHNNGNYESINKTNSGLKNDAIMDLAMDNSGTLWIGTNFDGIMTYSPDRGVEPFPGNTVFKSQFIMTLKFDEKNGILYANSLMDGVYAIDTSTRTVLGKIEGIPAGECRTLYIDRDNVLWIGTLTNGPMFYDARAGIAKKYNIYEKWQNKKVYAFCESKDGTLWIGYSEGVLQVNRGTQEIRVWTEKDGLHNHIIRGILEDSGGDLWISTLNGISRLNPRTGVIMNFYEYDGLQGNEFKNGAAFLTSDKRMYFGGAAGLTTFYPHLLKLSVHRISDIHLSSLKMMGEDVKYSASANGSGTLDKHLYKAEQIFIPRNCNSLAFGFSTLEYSNPNRVRFDYTMTRSDNMWMQTDISGLANYNNLKPGRHILKIKAYYEGDPDNYSSKEITVNVETPWYWSGWALLSYFTILTILTYVGMKSRKDKKKQIQEKQEAEKNRTRLEMFSNLTHEIRTPLFLILSPLKEMREIEKDSSQKEKYNLMYRNGLRINRIVNQFLDLRKVDEGHMHMHFKEADIVYIIKDIVKSFENYSQTKNIKVSLKFPDKKFKLWIDPGNFDKIIFNILSNAFKFTPQGGQVSLEVIPIDDQMNKKEFADITISNEGSHISDNDLVRIFDRFYQSGSSTGLSGSGIGLSLAKMLVELHHGKIWAENTDSGVCFTIRLPLGNSHLSQEELSATDHHKDLYVKQDDDFSIVDFPPKSDEPGNGTPKESRKMKRLVIVDDDEDTRKYIRAVFNDYAVDAFKDGDEAWNTISTKKVDAVITDLNMENMNGYSLCKKIKSTPHTSEIPVIILTSADEEESEKKCSDIGADRYYTKPVSTDIIKSGVAQAIFTRESIRMRVANKEQYDYDSIKITAYDEHLKDKIINTIKQHIDDSDFGVEELSETIGISRVHLNRKLKEIMGISPSVLIKNTRLKQAAYLLINSPQPNVSEIAYKVGFSTQSYFSTAFRDFFGQTPSEFVSEYNDKDKKEALKHLFQ